MRIIRTVGRRPLLAGASEAAFVPTMGNLHDGHAELVRVAQSRASQVAVSIYVNPLQFGPAEDLARYPRTLDADLERLEGLGVDVVYVPDDTEIYPRGIAAHTRVEVPGVGDILCGRTRPGHFRGVTTVVARLLHLVGASIAVFGKKDYQQWRIIERMGADLALPIEIVGVDTVRAGDGLALSSRNGYLTDGERREAPTLYQVLREAASAAGAGAGLSEVAQRTEAELTQRGFRVDYVEARARDLSQPTDDTTDLVWLAAAFLGTTRLIDNVEFVRVRPDGRR